jgi:predicted DNA-binding WGR domain protein
MQVALAAGGHMKPVRLNEALRLASEGGPWLLLLHTCPGALTKTGAQRSAFWRVEGKGRAALLVHGRRGTTGQRRRIAFSDVSRKVSEKLAGDYVYADDTSTATPLAAQSPSQRVQTLRDRLGLTTMRPTTMTQVWERIGAEGWTRQRVDADYSDIFRGCRALTLWQTRSGDWWVVVVYPGPGGDEWVWGAPRSA